MESRLAGWDRTAAGQVPFFFTKFCRPAGSPHRIAGVDLWAKNARDRAQPVAEHARDNASPDARVWGTSGSPPGWLRQLFVQQRVLDRILPLEPHVGVGGLRQHFADQLVQSRFPALAVGA